MQLMGGRLLEFQLGVFCNAPTGSVQIWIRIIGEFSGMATVIYVFPSGKGMGGKKDFLSCSSKSELFFFVAWKGWVD